MTREELSKEIALGLIDTGVEGPYDTVCCSTAGDYPSIGVSCWEGTRADILLSSIEGAEKFIGKTYSEIEEAGELDELAELLDSEQGQQVQINQLAHDALIYVDTVVDAGLEDERCIIYAGIWCPTSHYIVSRFIENRSYRININDLFELTCIFADEYATAADCEEYSESYENRAWHTYEYVSELDLSEYGVDPMEV